MKMVDYKKVLVGEVMLHSDDQLDIGDFIRTLVNNGYIAVIEKVDSEVWQISIYNKVRD